MEIGKGGPLDIQINQLERRRQEQREIAMEFPRSSEEYMQLHIQERLGVTLRILRSYANVSRVKGVPTKKECATAQISVNGPGIKVEARVGAVEHRDTSIVVWTNSISKEDQIETGFRRLGAIEFPWAQEAYLKLSYDDTRSLDDPAADQIIEIIDAASCNLIDGVIKQCQLGALAANQTVSS